MHFQGGKNYTFSYKKRFIKWLVFAFGMFMIGISFVLSFQENSSHKGARIWLVDTSLSMKTKDIHSPSGNISRLDLAKQIILSDTSLEKQALMTFARVTSLEMPLTRNTLLFQNVVSNMEIVRGAGGSDITQAIEQTIRIYGDTKNLQIILLTDGESFDKGELSENPNPEIQWNIIGIGTREGGAIVESYKNDGTPHYKTYQGKKVISKLDEVALNRLSEILSASYMQINTQKSLKNIDILLPKVSSQQSISFPRWFVFLGILSIILSFFILPYRYYHYD